MNYAIVDENGVVVMLLMATNPDTIAGNVSPGCIAVWGPPPGLVVGQSTYSTQTGFVP